MRYNTLKLLLLLSFQASKIQRKFFLVKTFLEIFLIFTSIKVLPLEEITIGKVSNWNSIWANQNYSQQFRNLFSNYFEPIRKTFWISFHSIRFNPNQFEPGFIRIETWFGFNRIEPDLIFNRFSLNEILIVFRIGSESFRITRIEFLSKTFAMEIHCIKEEMKGERERERERKKLIANGASKEEL